MLVGAAGAFSNPRTSFWLVVDRPGLSPSCWCTWSSGTVTPPGPLGPRILRDPLDPSGPFGPLGPSGRLRVDWTPRSPFGTLWRRPEALRALGTLRTLGPSEPFGSLLTGALWEHPNPLSRRAVRASLFARSWGPLCRPYDKPLAVKVLLRHG